MTEATEHTRMLLQKAGFPLLWLHNMSLFIYFYLRLISFGYISRSGIVGSYGNSSFSFLGNFHIVFQMSSPI